MTTLRVTYDKPTGTIKIVRLLSDGSLRQVAALDAAGAQQLMRDLATAVAALAR